MGETKKQKSGKSKNRKQEQAQRMEKVQAEERPACFVTEMDQYLFGQGTHYDIFQKLGAHPTKYQ